MNKNDHKVQSSKNNFHVTGCFKRNYKFLKGFTIGKTDQSHVNKIKCCLEEPFQRVP